jgi:hypothetical protein
MPSIISAPRNDLGHRGSGVANVFNGRAQMSAERLGDRGGNRVLDDDQNAVDTGQESTVVAGLHSDAVAGQRGAGNERPRCHFLLPKHARSYQGLGVREGQGLGLDYPPLTPGLRPHRTGAQPGVGVFPDKDILVFPK